MFANNILKSTTFLDHLEQYHNTIDKSEEIKHTLNIYHSNVNLGPL